MRPEPVDIVVFAPHPDDEVICCAGVIQQALSVGKKVRVVFSTNGDGYPRAAATLLGKSLSDLTTDDMERLGDTRRREAIAAAAELGLREQDLVFLGQHDAKLPAEEREALPRFVELLRGSKPRQICVPHPADEHADHAATYRIVSAAIDELDASPQLFIYMVHSDGDRWPPPGPRFERGGLDRSVPWPPPVRISLTAAEQDAKRRALKEHRSQWALDHDYLGRFVKSEEVFWRPAGD